MVKGFRISCHRSLGELFLLFKDKSHIELYGAQKGTCFVSIRFVNAGVILGNWLRGHVLNQISPHPTSLTSLPPHHTINQHHPPTTLAPESSPIPPAPTVSRHEVQTSTHSPGNPPAKMPPPAHIIIFAPPPSPTLIVKNFSTTPSKIPLLHREQASISLQQGPLVRHTTRTRTTHDGWKRLKNGFAVED